MAIMKRPGSLGLRLSVLVMAISALSLACEASSSLLSDSERSSLYTITALTSSGQSLANGSLVVPGSALSLSIGKGSGVSDPAAVDVSLATLSGASAASLHFTASTVSQSSSLTSSSSSSSTSQASSSTSSVKSVTSLSGKLDGFSIPTQASGMYSLTVTALDSAGGTLQQNTFTVFVDKLVPSIASMSVYPPSIEPGSAALLNLNVAWTDASSGASVSGSGRDPWIRWSKDGVSFAEGLLSAGYNKAVWTAPLLEGAYSVTAEVFPSAPATGTDYSFKASATQDLKVMVIAPPGGSANDFAPASSFYSLLTLSGSFADSGTRNQTQAPAAFGSPQLASYSGGFGYQFSGSSGVNIPGLMPPSSGNGMGAFAVLVRLMPNASDGNLVSFVSSDGSFTLSLGLQSGSPLVTCQSGSQTQKSLAQASLPQTASTIEAVFTPDGSSLDIAWRIEGKYVAAPSIVLPFPPTSGSAILGGSSSLAGIYSGFGLMVPGSSYPSPAFVLAERRALKSSLVYAESFETGLPSTASSSGTLSTSTAGLSLSPGSSVSLSSTIDLSAVSSLSLGITGDSTSLSLNLLDPSGNLLASISGSGQLSDASGSSLGYVSPSASGLNLAVRYQNAVLSFTDKSGAIVSIAKVPRKCQLSLFRGASGKGSLLATNLLLSSLSPSF